nr:hypothetical protein [Planotetraspora silvatica]
MGRSGQVQSRPSTRGGGSRPSPALLELVEELSRESEDFRRMWANHDV